jgi:hypothetical protein
MTSLVARSRCAPTKEFGPNHQLRKTPGRVLRSEWSDPTAPEDFKVCSIVLTRSFWTPDQKTHAMFSKNTTLLP